MDCAICRHAMTHCFDAVVMRRYNARYWSCDECGLLATEKPFWLAEAYGEAIATSDTGLVARNVALSRKVAALLFVLFERDGLYVDVAGGTGLFVRLMRDIGFDFRWHDPYSKNVHARGFEFIASDQPVSAATAFEVLEHVEDPVAFLRDTLAMCRTDTIILSTELFEGPPPDPDRWWYYARESGQHIAFYQRRTLERLATALGLQLLSFQGLHMFTTRRISTAAFRFGAGRASRIALPIVRHFLSSRTMKDHDAIVRHSEVHNRTRP